MNMKQKLYDKGIEKYPLASAIGQNLFFVIYFAIAFIGMSSLQINNIPIVSIIYIVFIPKFDSKRAKMPIYEITLYAKTLTI